MNQTLAILLALFLVALNGFFVAAEFALVKVRATRLAELSQGGNKAARLAEKVLGKLDAYLSACQLGITFASLGLGWIGEPAFAHLFEKWLHGVPGMTESMTHTAGFLSAFLLITALHIVLGEMAPKSAAISRPEQTSMLVALPMTWFYNAFYPAIWALNGLANLSLRLVKIEPVSEHEMSHSEEEIRMLLAHSHAQGTIPLIRQRLLQNVFTFGRRTARQILIPRADVSFLRADEPFPQLLDRARDAGHTRFPVCDGELDRVLGIAHIKDLFKESSAAGDIRKHLRTPLFIPEAMTAEKLLLTFQENRQHLAIVVDEYGGASGIVTLEDVIEELVGEVQDEFDEEAPQFIPVRKDGYLVSGGMLVEAVAAQLGVHIEEIDADTIGGYVQLKLGQVGRVGDEVPFGSFVVRVVEVKGQRLVRLLLVPASAPRSA